MIDDEVTFPQALTVSRLPLASDSHATNGRERNPASTLSIPGTGSVLATSRTRYTVRSSSNQRGYSAIAPVYPVLRHHPLSGRQTYYTMGGYCTAMDDGEISPTEQTGLPIISCTTCVASQN
jgi:hypothetical protein